MKRTGQGGFIKAVVAIALALVVLKYVFHFDLLNIFYDPRVKPYSDAVFNFVFGIWNSYLWPVIEVVVRHSTTAGLFIWKYILIAMAWLKETFLRFYPEFLRPW